MFVRIVCVYLSKQKLKHMKEETFEEIQKRKKENKDEVNHLIHTSDWEIDDYDEMDGYIFITICKKKK